ncbi:XRE family transcriptional regulator [Acinetobacter chinensis]|uniref:Helix-turn-helix transcriptional regulator n=1 Tax=Acinetobacter chinensis TaxID=2004650 RepID=A0A3B7LYV4_9GAMM|nr:helix-turn-helix transcriptional regulator [Acinetobacter chinensis]AXY58100.1 XRE family transcriptional regulator [Acinetobacter chinensis]MDV2469269.1 helix-turn-helix transcriptional regulator [Acinetobacter chinensis]
MSNRDDEFSAFVDGAKRIKQLIQEKNIKTSDIVSALEVSKDTVGRWLQGQSVPSAQSLMELAKYLGVSERWILEGKPAGAESGVPADLVLLKQASVEQLMNELKLRYAELNLDAEIRVSVRPVEGGFVTRED